VSATQDQLVIEPREPREDLAAFAERLDCCFPGGISYTIRTSNQWALFGSVGGFRHDVTAGNASNGFACQRDADPLKRSFKSRAFEISAAESCVRPESAEPTDPTCRVGSAEPGEPALCAILRQGQSVPPNSPCIFQNLNARFAVYRGSTRSQRGMSFRWRTTGGFAPLVVGLTGQSAAVMPRALNYLSQTGQMAVVDGQSLGLVLFSLDKLRIDQDDPVIY
jgi:hypothetical protein